jgi:hypothetical protein
MRPQGQRDQRCWEQAWCCRLLRHCDSAIGDAGRRAPGLPCTSVLDVRFAATMWSLQNPRVAVEAG